MKIPRRASLLSLGALVLTFLAGGFYLDQLESRREEEARRHLTELVASTAWSIHRQLNRSVSATYALASHLRVHGEIRGFDELAAEIISTYGGISSLQLAPDAVVTKIYPLAGNEKAIGHNLLEDPERRTEAMAAIESGELTLAGPLELIQGGVAVIARLPVSLRDENGEDVFWGFTIVLIRLKDFLPATHLVDLAEKGYDCELSRIHPDSGEKEVFYRSGGPLESAVGFAFEVPNGEWTLSIAPRVARGGRVGVHEYGFVLLIASVLAYLLFLVLRRSEILMARTRELGDTNAKLEEALREVKTLSGLLPICSYCKQIKDDRGEWRRLEEYLLEHADVQVSHGMCEKCLEAHHPDIWGRIEGRGEAGRPEG